MEQIFVSSTVRDLLLGGDTRFDDRGEHMLKGFDSPWRLYALAELSEARQASGRRAMTAGSRPAKTQPAANATSGVPTAMTAR